MKKHRALRALVCILIALALLLALVVGGSIAYFRLSARGYYSASRAAFTIPGMSDGNVPQSMTYVSDGDTFLLSGYMKDHVSPSLIYRVDRATGADLGSVVPARADGSTMATHCGGMAYHDGLVYLSCEVGSCLTVYRAEDILSAAAGDTVIAIGELSLEADGDKVKSSFICESAEGIVVGEFYREKGYPTAESHWIETENGVNHALAVVYPYAGTDIGVADVPVLAYSLPDLVQGMAFDGDDIYLTQSYALALSTVPRYTGVTAEGEITALGQTLPLITLTDADLASCVTVAPMAEQPVILDGEFYLNCESASSQYIFGNLIGARSLYATDMTFMRGE